MEKQEERFSLLSLIGALVVIATVVGTVVYTFSKLHQKKQEEEKWKDYEECGV